MGQPTELRLTDGLSSGQCLASSIGSIRCHNTSSSSRISSGGGSRDRGDSRCRHDRESSARFGQRAQSASTSCGANSCASHTAHNQTNSTARREEHTRSHQSPPSILSPSSHTPRTTTTSSTDSVFCSSTSATTDSVRKSQTSSPQWYWLPRRMYMGNITSWSLSLAFYLLVIVLSHHVVSTQSLPAASRRVVEQRMRRVDSLDEYISAFSANETITPLRSRYLVERNTSPLNKRSGRRWGRAGKDSGTTSRESSFMARVEAEHTRASCQPRDRVVDAYEELGIPRGYDVYIYPQCIVVRRCNQGGCCRDNQECVPSRRTNITMNFLKNLESITREIVHDTECSCQDKPSFCPPPPKDCDENKVWSYSECTCKCRNRCPKPFLQDEDSCGCDCLSQDRTCKNIYRGRRNLKLAREECECVKKGLCARPPCLNGRFSMDECKCINSSS